MSSHRFFCRNCFFIWLLMGVLSSCGKLEEISFIQFKADFSAPLVVRSGDTIQFEAGISTAGASSFLWNFGDRKGSTSNAFNPTFQYDTIGSFDVKLEVKIRKSEGILTDSIRKIVRVLPNTINEFSTTYSQKKIGQLNQDEFGMAMDATLDGGFVLTGRRNLNGLFVTRLDASQNEVWEREFTNLTSGSGQIFPQDIIETSDFSFVIVGYVQYNLNSNDNDAFILKLDSDGFAEWILVLNSSNNEVYTSVSETEFGDYFVTGTFFTLNRPAIALHEFTTDGGVNVFTQIPQDKCSSCRAGKAQRTNDGGFVIAATEINRPSIVKIDADYTFTSKSTLNFTGRGLSATELSNGNFILVGETRNSSSDSTNAFISRFDLVGGVESWRRNLVLYQESFIDVQENEDRDIIVIGNHFNPLSGKDILVAQFERLRGRLSGIRLVGNNGENEISGLRITDNGTFLVGTSGEDEAAIGRKACIFLEIKANFFEN